MRKAHAFVVSGLLAGSVVAGALAAMKTSHLGAAASKPATVPGSVIAAQQGRLDRWSTSLSKALKATPPALPKVPHFDPVAIPAVPRLLASAPAPTVRHVAVHRTIAAPEREQLPVAPAPTTTTAQPAPVVTYVQAPPATAWGGDDSAGDDGYGDGGGD